MSDVPQLVDELFAVLAERFGTTGAHLWEVLVRQAYIDAVSWIAGLVFMVAALTVGWLAVRRMDPRQQAQESAVAYVLLACASLFGLILIACGVLPIATGLFNPEYFALQKVLEALP